MNKVFLKQLIIILGIIFSSHSLAQSHNHFIFSADNKHQISNYDFFQPNYKIKSDANFMKLDSIITNSMQGSGYKLLFKYNDNRKITEWLMLINFGSGWVTTGKNIRLYDEQNNLITELELSWNENTGKGDSSSRHNYSYEMGMLSRSIFQLYIDGTWENRGRYSYGYDMNQNLLTTLIEKWINNAWQRSDLITFYYSAPNKRDSVLLQSWANDEWQNDIKTFYYYKDDGLDLDSIVVKSWNGISWINYFKQDIVNDANHNQIEQIDNTWSGYSWMNSLRRHIIYNEANYMESMYCELLSNKYWVDGEGDFLFQYSNEFRAAFITHSLSAYYSKIVSIEEKDNSPKPEYDLFQNFPNPFNPTTTIQYSLPSQANVTLTVFDILGNEIATLVNEEKQAGHHEVQFDASNLSSNVYFYQLSINDLVKTLKMIVVK